MWCWQLVQAPEELFFLPRTLEAELKEGWVDVGRQCSFFGGKTLLN